METKFTSGDRVRVREDYPSTHMRTPAYIQGKTGIIAAIHGAFRNPESLAYGGDGLPKQVLYLVRFDEPHVWANYQASPRDKILVDLYEHWLEPA